MLHNVLIIYKLIFDGKLGTWKTKHVTIELQQDDQQYHSKLHPLTRAHKFVFKKDVDRILQTGSLKRQIDQSRDPQYLFN